MIRKYIVMIGLMFLLLVGMNVCQAQPVVFGRGTVVRTSFAVGHWGIISEKSFNGTQYFDPVVLPFRFRFDGLRVWFLGRLLPFNPNIQMWGNPVLLVKMIRWM
jgi:hypothetical protein